MTAAHAQLVTSSVTRFCDKAGTDWHLRRMPMAYRKCDLVGKSILYRYIWVAIERVGTDLPLIKYAAQEVGSKF